MTQTSSSSAQSTWPALSGSVYVQGVILCGVSNVGLASYHFDGPSSAYISYENRRARQWRLDNNTYFPAQKQFTNTSYDPATRTFRGTIDWRPRKVGEAAIWRYKIVFSSDFRIICDGAVEVYTSEDVHLRQSGWVFNSITSNSLHYRKLSLPFVTRLPTIA